MKISKQKRSSCSKKSKQRLYILTVKESIKNIEKSLQKNMKLSKKVQPILKESLQKHNHNQIFSHKQEKMFKSKLSNQNQRLRTEALQEVVEKNPNFKDDNKIRNNSNSKTKHKIRLYSPKHLFHNQKTLVKKTSSKRSTQNSSEQTLIQQLKTQNQYYLQKYTESMEKLSKLSKELHQQRKIHQAQKVLYQRKIYQLKYQIFLNQEGVNTPIDSEKNLTENQFQSQQINDLNYQLKLLSNISQEQ